MHERNDIDSLLQQLAREACRNADLPQFPCAEIARTPSGASAGTVHSSSTVKSGGSRGRSRRSTIAAGNGREEAIKWANGPDVRRLMGFRS